MASLSEAQRRRAFAVVAVAVAAAVCFLIALGRDDGTHPPAHVNKLVVKSPAADPTAGEPDRRRSARAARSTARRFALAYLARDSGRDDPASRRDLHATSTTALWETLRQPIRVPPATRPPRARFERVSGIAETGSAREVAATVEYSRAGDRRYLRLVLVDEAGAWRTSGIGR